MPARHRQTARLFDSAADPGDEACVMIIWKKKVRIFAHVSSYLNLHQTHSADLRKALRAPIDLEDE